MKIEVHPKCQSWSADHRPGSSCSSHLVLQALEPLLSCGIIYRIRKCRDHQAPKSYEILVWFHPVLVNQNLEYCRHTAGQTPAVTNEPFRLAAIGKTTFDNLILD